MELSASKTFGNFPVECLEDIFGHLVDDDLLNCCVVCPSWNDYIGSSKYCMENVLVSCEKGAKINKLKKALLKSQRKYVCLTVEGNYSEEIRELLNIRSWTHIIADMRFDAVTDFLEFLGLIQTALQDLFLQGVIVKKDFNPDTKFYELQFPHLRDLSIGEDFSAYYDRTFVNCKILKSLDVHVCDPISQSALDAIKNSLSINSALEKLEILKILVIDSDLLSEVNFKLTEFHALGLQLENPRSLQIFCKFLVTQRDTLEIVKIDGWGEIAVGMKTILSMPRLQELHLSGEENLDRPLDVNFKGELIPRNFSVSHLDLTRLQFGSYTFKLILNAFPNLHMLIVKKIDDENVDEIEKLFNSSNKLNVIYMDPEDIPVAFESNQKGLFFMNQYQELIRLGGIEFNSFRRFEKIESWTTLLPEILKLLTFAVLLLFFTCILIGMLFSCISNIVYVIYEEYTKYFVINLGGTVEFQSNTQILEIDDFSI